jgi:hypothetical protein
MRKLRKRTKVEINVDNLISIYANVLPAQRTIEAPGSKQ